MMIPPFSRGPAPRGAWTHYTGKGKKKQACNKKKTNFTAKRGSKRHARAGGESGRKNFLLPLSPLCPLATTLPGRLRPLTAVPPSRLRSHGSSSGAPPDGSAPLTAVLSLAAVPPYSSVPLAAALPRLAAALPHGCALWTAVLPWRQRPLAAALLGRGAAFPSGNFAS